MRVSSPARLQQINETKRQMKMCTALTPCIITGDEVCGGGVVALLAAGEACVSWGCCRDEVRVRHMWLSGIAGECV